MTSLDRFCRSFGAPLTRS